VLVAGGSGVVPLMAMLRHRRNVAPELPMRLLYSARGADDVIYADDVDDDVALTYTREPPSGWSGHTGRIDAAFVAAAEPAGAICFVCGADGFVSAASGLLIEAGADRPMIRTERFGPTGA
jgi:ferredoxin-NADP reductase